MNDKKNKSGSKKHINSEEEQNIFLEFLEKMPSDPEFQKKLNAKTQSLKKLSSDTKSKSTPVTLDLHGKNLDDAMKSIDVFFEELKSKGNSKTIADITIVTGRGIRSSDGPVLATSIYDYVKSKYQQRIIFLDGSPGDLLLKDGTAFKGNFRIRLK